MSVEQHGYDDICFYRNYFSSLVFYSALLIYKIKLINKTNWCTRVSLFSRCWVGSRNKWVNFLFYFPGVTLNLFTADTGKKLLFSERICQNDFCNIIKMTNSLFSKVNENQLNGLLRWGWAWWREWMPFQMLRGNDLNDLWKCVKR